MPSKPPFPPGLAADLETPDPGWVAAGSHLPPGLVRSFVAGDPRADGLGVRYFRREADGALVAKVWFGPRTQGPPGHVHGGAMAAVLDEAMGLACWIAGHKVVAAGFRIDFRSMLRLGSLARVEAWIVGREGRKLAPRARLLAGAGEVVAESVGTFVVLGEERMAALRRLVHGERAAGDPAP